jgi:hypothetical protein
MKNVVLRRFSQKKNQINRSPRPQMAVIGEISGKEEEFT